MARSIEERYKNYRGPKGEKLPTWESKDDVEFELASIYRFGHELRDEALAHL